MEKHLKYYVKVFDNVVDDSVCDQTIAELQNANWTQHTFYDAGNEQYVNQSGERELDVCYHNTSTINHLMEKIWYSYFTYLNELHFPWFGSWQGFTTLRYNRYVEGRVMAKHCDHIHSIYDGQLKGVPILTALGVLNDDYQGGSLVMFDDDVIEMKKGSIVVFPSNFLFPHLVEPVTEGTRYSYVSWAS